MASMPTLGDLHMTHDPAGRGYHAVYREHQVNHCPGCGRTHWLIGRVSAECAFCSTALPLLEPGMNGGGMIRRPVRNDGAETPLAA